MFRQRRQSICGHWDCGKRIPGDSFLCDRHYEGWVNGLIDRCPKCGRFKEVMYRLCLDCYFGRPVARWEPSVIVPDQKSSYRVQYSEAWIDGYMRPDRFFVYILELDEGVLYVGHTANLYERLSGLREQRKSSTAGHMAKLQYVEIIATERAAEAREVELKRLIEANPSQIEVMISEFHSRMREFGLE